MREHTLVSQRGTIILGTNAYKVNSNIRQSQGKNLNRYNSFGQEGYVSVRQNLQGSLGRVRQSI